MKNDWANLHIVKENRFPTACRLKSAGGRRIVLAATCRAAQPRENREARRQVNPPCSLGGKGREETLLFMSLLLRRLPKGAS